MERQVITKLNRSFDETAYEQNGMEYWLARDIQVLLEYDEWRNFSKVIEKAKTACENAGQKEGDHFVDVNKTIPMPKGAEKIVGRLSARKKLEATETELSKSISERGVDEDLKKLERRVKTEENKLGKISGKLLRLYGSKKNGK